MVENAFVWPLIRTTNLSQACMSVTAEVVPVVLADVFAVSRLFIRDSKSTRISVKIVNVSVFFSSVNPPGSRELTLKLIKVICADTCRE